MQAVILAAGLGTRMGELTKDKPKVLLETNGGSILEQDLAALPEEVDEVILVVGYKADLIRKVIGDKYREKSIRYVEQKELKGTGHALSLCKDLLHDRFLVFYGDDLYNSEDLAELVKHPLGILVYELSDDKFIDAGKAPATVKVDSSGKLVDIVERQAAQKGTLINTGAYVLDKRYFDYPLVPAGIPANEYGLPQTMLQMIGDGAEFAVIRASGWRKITNSDDLTSN